MPPATQMFRTSSGAFLVTVLGAMGIATWLTTGIIVGSPPGYDSSIPSEFWPATFAGYFAALFGATAGGLLALLCGARLSRQYCWLFATAAGFMMIWCGSVAFFRTMMMLPSSPGMLPGMRSSAVPLASIGAAVAVIGGGITWGVLMTRRRIGFGPRSRRAAIIGMLAGAIAFVALVALWAVLESRPQSRTFFGIDVWLHVVLGSLLTITGGVIGAVAWTERYEAPRFAVLPVAQRQSSASS